jgi:hypothetical protein
MSARSDSSRQIRLELMKGNDVPDTRNTISIRQYFTKAMTMYEKAVKSMEENYTSRSYIYWKQFVVFTLEKLPQHKHVRWRMIYFCE